MSAIPDAYTIEEVQRLIGRRVKLLFPMPDRFVGETGMVRWSCERWKGYVVAVEWDVAFGDGRKRYDLFTPDQFNVMLREV